MVPRAGGGRDRDRPRHRRVYPARRSPLPDAAPVGVEGKGVEPGRVTFATHFESWLDRRKRGAKGCNPQTIAQHEWAAGYLLPAQGKLLVKDVRPEHIDKVLERMARGRASRNSMARVRNVANMVMTDAVKRRLIDWNPVSVTETPDGPTRERKSLTWEQVDALEDIIRGDRLEGCYLVQLHGELRPGEACGLVWEDIDLDAGVIHVRQARVHTPEGVAIGELKTGKSEGDVAIPIHVVEALRTHRTRQAEEKMRHRDVYADDGLVFATRLGTPIDRWSLRRSFGDLTEQAGLGRLHPTILRHTFTSRMLDADVPTEKVRAALRHSPGSRTLERHYSHQVRPTVGEATRRAIEERYGTAN